MTYSIKNIFLVLFFTTHYNCMFGQENGMIRTGEPKESFKDKLFTGGNLGLQFGEITFVDVSPLLGYRITEKFHAGIGVTYQYYRHNTYNFETDVYGGRVFSRYFVYENLFIHGEYEYLNLESFDFKRRRVDVESLLGGVGYFQRFGENSGIMAMLLYNFTESVYTPYSNPIFRIGFNIGF